MRPGQINAAANAKIANTSVVHLNARLGRTAVAQPMIHAARNAGAMDGVGHSIPARSKLRVMTIPTNADNTAKPNCHPADMNNSNHRLRSVMGNVPRISG